MGKRTHYNFLRHLHKVLGVVGFHRLAAHQKTSPILPKFYLFVSLSGALYLMPTKQIQDSDQPPLRGEYHRWFHRHRGMVTEPVQYIQAAQASLHHWATAFCQFGHRHRAKAASVHLCRTDILSLFGVIPKPFKFLKGKNEETPVSGGSSWGSLQGKTGITG